MALRELGINMNLAPVADVVESGDHFLFNRSYSGDPEEVASFVEAVVSGYEKAGVVAVVKHFLGHGAAAGDTHRGLPVVTLSREELEKGHLLPFRRAVDVGVPAVMAASVESLKAGADLLLVGHTLARQALVEAVRNGGVSEERLDAAVLRVLRLKREHGIW